MEETHVERCNPLIRQREKTEETWWVSTIPSPFLGVDDFTIVYGLHSLKLTPSRPWKMVRLEDQPFPLGWAKALFSGANLLLVLGRGKFIYWDLEKEKLDFACQAKLNKLLGDDLWGCCRLDFGEVKHRFSLKLGPSFGAFRMWDKTHAYPPGDSSRDLIPDRWRSPTTKIFIPISWTQISVLGGSSRDL